MLGLVYRPDYQDKDAETRVRLRCEFGEWCLAMAGPRVEHNSRPFAQQTEFDVHGHTPRGERRGNEGIITDIAHRSTQNVDDEQAQYPP